MWSNYQLETAVKTLAARERKAWHDLKLMQVYCGYTFEMPIDAKKDPSYMKALNVWCALKGRLEAAENQMERQKLN